MFALTFLASQSHYDIWQTGLVWLHLLFDSLILLAYYRLHCQLKSELQRQAAETARTKTAQGTQSLNEAHLHLQLELLECEHTTKTLQEQIDNDITERKRIEDALLTSGVRLAGILDTAEYGIISIDINHQITLFNKGAEKIFGYSATEILGQPLDLVLPKHFLLSYCQCLQQCSQSRCASPLMGEHLEIVGRRKDGTEFPAEASISRLELVSGEVLTVMLRDITERKRGEADLQQANEQLSSWVKQLEAHNREIALLSEISKKLQACLTVEEAYQALSQLLQPLFPDCSGGILLQKTPTHILEPVATWGDLNLARELLLITNECCIDEYCTVFLESTHGGLLENSLDKDVSMVNYLSAPIRARGEVLGLLFVSSPQLEFIEARQRLASAVAENIGLALANLKLHEALHNQSIRDPLTGLFNRRYLVESLQREISSAQRQQYSIGIIILDIDHFKKFNDSFGHEAGDTVLQKLGTFLNKQVRGGDIACRYGGEEFLLILPKVSLEIARERAEQVRQGVKLLDVQSQGQHLGTITVSLGVALFPIHGSTPEAAIRSADAAMYRAKAAGRDCVMLAT